MNRSIDLHFLNPFVGRVWFFWVALIVTALLTTGCSSDSSGSTVPAEGSSESPPSAQLTADADDAVDLGDFQVPAPPGGAVGRVMSDAARGITYGASEMDAIIAFYEKWLSEPGLKSAAGVVVTEYSGQMTLLASTEDERTFYNIIATPGESDIFLALQVITE